jgi:hypothetical protein
MAIREHNKPDQISQDDWALTADQMLFMFQHHNPIETAYASDDMDFLRELATSEAYRVAFGDMPWDEAYDRYKCMVEDEDGNP